MKSPSRRENRVSLDTEQELSSPADRASFPAQLLAALETLIANCSVTVDEIDTDRRTWKKARVPAAVACVWSAASPLRVRQIDESRAPVNSDSETNHLASRGRIAIILPGRGHVTRLTFIDHGNLSARELIVLNLLSAWITQERTRAHHHFTPEEERTSLQQVVSRASTPVRLTPRETEVLSWVAQGKRNREIGLILNTSSRTIQKHVQSILDKLNVETRGAAAAWWFEHGG